MIRSMFEHRSGRVIAVSRIAMAALFGVWMWLDPSQPGRGGNAGYLLLTGYIAYACLLFPIAWIDWWLDHRLRFVTFGVDCGIFLAAMSFTEGGGSDFVSAYIGFFTFLTLSCVLRWNWRATLIVAVVLALLYIGVGTAVTGAPFDPLTSKLPRRASYMLAVAAIVTWFARQQTSPAVRQFELPPPLSGASPFAEALKYAMGQTGATGAALAWENTEEPGFAIHLGGTLETGTRHVAPGEIDLSAHRDSYLFERRKRRALRMSGGKVVAETGSEGPPLAVFLDLPAGLSVPVSGTTGMGQLILVGIPGLNRDHLLLGEAIAREIAHGLDEEEASALAREAAAMRLRGNIARDLHDSVAQSLAGAGYLLASLRSQIDDGKDVRSEIEAIRESLSAEQANIREIIARLRSGEVNPGKRNLHVELDRLLRLLSRQWRVEAHIEDPEEPLVVPSWLLFEIRQIVREGVANAVRHGAARNIVVRCERAAGGLSLVIGDDGTGFPAAGTCSPQTIAERVDALGGRMDLASIGGHTHIDIYLPVGGR